MNDPTKYSTEKSHSHNDFLARFQEAHMKSPDVISQRHVIALTAANLFAGSDTTAATLSAALYFLLNNPEKMERLQREVDQIKNGKADLVAWKDVRDLPYLGAVIKEALRCCPAVGLPLERVVPAAGATICDHFLPSGTIVGCSAWTIHLDEKIFGHEPEKFRPERWLDASVDTLKDMNESLFTFGAGSRTCIGKNISLLELFKVLPAILRAFEVSCWASNVIVYPTNCLIIFFSYLSFIRIVSGK